MERKITVTGAGIASVAPDVIGLNIRVETVRYRYDETLEVASAASHDLQELILANDFGEKDLKTTSFQVDTKYRNYNDAHNKYKQEFVGYSCVQRFQLEFPIDFARLSQVLSGIAETAIQPKLDIYFTIADQDAVKELVLLDATKKARRNAQVLADAAGMKLGDILRIDYSWSELHLQSETQYELYDSAPRMMAAKIEPHITPGDIDVSDSVTFVWELKVE